MNAKETIEQMAREDGVSAEFVRGQIEIAIGEAQKSSDPQAGE